MPRLFVISAPSGAGKTTLSDKVLRALPDRLTLSVSTTTRAPRGSEQHGREYYFIAVDEFKRRIDQGRFAEWALVHGNYYGTAKETIESAFAQGRSVLLPIDVQGGDTLSKAYPAHCCRIFIAPPDLKELENRLRARGTDSDETIRKRLENALHEMEHGRHYDHTIVNDTLERAYEELKRVIEKEMARG